MTRLLLLILCVRCLASEATLTYSATAGGDGTWYGIMTLPRFNPALGTLKSATLVYRLEYGASLALGSLEPFPIQMPVDSSLTFHLESPGRVPIGAESLWVFNVPMATYGGFETNRMSVSAWSEAVSNVTGTGNITFYAWGDEYFNYAFPWYCDVSYCTWSNWRLTMTYKYEVAAH